jgi:uncharacterized protein YjbI with pentapeptide repeats
MKQITQITLDSLLRYHQGYLDNKALIKYKDSLPNAVPGQQLVLNECNLRGLDFRRVDLTDADLSGSDATGANFMGCAMPEEKYMPEINVCDLWGQEFHGSEEAAQKAYDELLNKSGGSS